MVGFELKAVVVILLIISIVLNMATYEERWSNRKKILWGFIEIEDGTAPKRRFWLLFFASIGLFMYGLYLNEYPVILF